LKNERIYEFLIDEEKANYTCPLCDEGSTGERLRKLEDQLEEHVKSKGKKRNKTSRTTPRKKTKLEDEAQDDLKLDESKPSRYLIPYRGRKLIVPPMRIPLLLIESETKK
jgi:hypothetical protein